MNKLFLLLSLCLLTAMGYGQALQNKDVPTNLTAKIQSLYPDAEKVEWEMEDGFYEASFRHNKQQTSVVLSHQAILVRTEVELDKSAWPSFVKSFLATQPGALKAEEVDMITDIYGKVTYEVEAGDMEYLLDANGILISKQSDEDDEDGEDHQ